MKVYITSTGRVFHKDEDCTSVGTNDVTTHEVADDTKVLNNNRRLIARCRRCFPNLVPLEKEVITIGEAADVMGMSAAQAKELARNGQFPGAFKLSPGKTGWWRVSVQALESFLETPVNG